MSTATLSALVRRWLVKFHRGTFGEWFDSSDVKPKSNNVYDAVILCKNNGTGLDPLYLRLPHQIYRKDLKDILAEFPDTKDLVAIPVNSSDYINLWEEKYRRLP